MTWKLAIPFAALAFLALPAAAEVRAQYPKIENVALTYPTEATSVRLTWTSPFTGTEGIVYYVYYSGQPITAVNFRDALQVPWTDVARLMNYRPEPPGNEQVLVLTDNEVEGLGSSWHLYFAISYVAGTGGSSPVSNCVEGVYDLIAPGSAQISTTTSTHNTVTVTWAAPASDGLNLESGSAAAYDLRVSDREAIVDETTFGRATPVSIAAPKTPGTTETFVIPGLRLETTYHFALKTRDVAFNWSSLSNELVVTTPSDTIRPGTIELAVVETGLDTVTLAWVEPGDDGVEFTAAAYDLRVSEEGPISDDGHFNGAARYAATPAPSAPGTRRTMIVTGLEQRTTYHFAMKAGDFQPNWGLISNSVAATTRLGGSFGTDMACGGSAGAGTGFVMLALAAAFAVRR